MQIILLEKVVNLGELGDVVNVKDGYGRNFLIPYGKAKRATTVNLAEFEAKRVELEKQQAALEKVAKKRVKEFEGFGIEISQKVGVDGKLFGSVTNIDIADAINAAGHKVVKSEIRMPNGPLKLIGEHELTIDLHHEMTAIIKVTVVGEEI
jgi:large subunit ribosomal protein L9